MEKKECCPDKLEVRPHMFYYRGKYFSGLVCPEHNALWDNPDDSFMKYVIESNPPNQSWKRKNAVNKPSLKNVLG